MRKTRVTSLVVLAMAVAMVFAAALPAGALGPAGAIIFRGVAQSAGICYPGAKSLNPNTGATAGCASDSINNGAVRTWQLNIGNGTISPPLNSADFCVGADSTGRVGVVKYGVPAFNNGTACDLEGSGQVLPGPAYEAAGVHSPVKVGPYCGASHGNGSFKSTLGNTTIIEQVEWIQSAATVLPTVDGDPSNTNPDRDTNGDGIKDTADKVLTAGVTDAVGALAGGDCGLTGVSIGFNVIGVAVAVGQ